MMLIRPVTVGITAIVRMGNTLVWSVRIDDRASRLARQIDLALDPTDDGIETDRISQIRKQER